MSSSAPTALRITLLTALLCLIWGSTWMVIQGGLRDLPPLGSAAARFTVAALGMSVLAALFAAREGGTRPAPGLSLVHGSLNIAANFGVVYWSETRLPSGLVSLLYAVYPMLQAVAGHLFLPAERLGRAQSAGFVLGFLGVASIFAADLRAIGPEAVSAGAVMLLAPVFTAIGTTYIKRHGAGSSSLLMNRNGMCIGAALLWAAAFLVERDEPVALTGAAVFSVLYLSVLGSVVAFGTYFWLLRHTTAGRLSVIAYVVPAIALSLGVLLGGEPITPFTFVGFALILAGVFLVHRGALIERARLLGSTPASS